MTAAGSAGSSGGGSNADNNSGPSGKSSAGKWQPSQLAGGAVVGGGTVGGGRASGFSPTPAAHRGTEASGNVGGFAFSIPQAAPSGTASGNASNAPTPPRWRSAEAPAAPEASGAASGNVSAVAVGGSFAAPQQRPAVAADIHDMERGGGGQTAAVQPF